LITNTAPPPRLLVCIPRTLGSKKQGSIKRRWVWARTAEVEAEQCSDLPKQEVTEGDLE
jgi:hypothetical protein